MTAGAVGAFVVAYLIGSVDFAVVVARFRGVDIHDLGSGNPGAANVMRTMGWRAAVPVMIGDLAKGAVAALVGSTLGGSEAAGWAAGFAAVVGHCFPVWHRLRGGKGVATSFGVVLLLEPLLGVVLIAMWVALLVLTRISSIGSLVAVVAMMPGLAIVGAPTAAYAWAGAIAMLVVVRHRSNIAGLRSGRERTV